MKLDFSQCKTPEDVDKVWKTPKVVKELKAIKHLLSLQLETSGISKKQISRTLRRRRWT
jgi:hypothetical protein